VSTIGAFGDRRDEAGSTTSNIGMAGETIREVLADRAQRGLTAGDPPALVPLCLRAAPSARRIYLKSGPSRRCS